MKYRQCTLERDSANGRCLLVEWVPTHLATIGGLVACNGHEWKVSQVGQECDDPRAAHDSAKAFPSIQRRS